MKILLRIFVPGLLFCCLMAFPSVAAFAQDDAAAIVARSHKKTEVQTEVALLVIKTFGGKSDNIRNEVLSLTRNNPDGTSDYVLCVLSPEDVKGVALLSRETADGRQQYLSLPGSKRVKKISGSSMSRPFLRSNFNYADLMRERLEDWTYTQESDVTVQQHKCHVFLAKPSDRTLARETGYWGRRLYIDSSTFDLIQVEYFESERDKEKNLRFYQYNSSRVDGPSVRPERAIMVHSHNRSTSAIELVRSRLNVTLADEMFDPENLNGWGPRFAGPAMAIFQQPGAPAPTPGQ